MDDEQTQRMYRCPVCGKTEPCSIDPATNIIQCEDCGGHDGRVTRIAFGVPQPRVIIDPCPEDGRRFVMLTIGEHSFKLDLLYCIDIGHELLGLRGCAEMLAATLSCPPESGGTTLES